MAEIIDDRTAVGDLPLPNALNRLRDDVERIRAAIEGSASSMAANAAGLGARAPLVHQHEIGQIVGLLDALGAKMAADWRPTLDELVDVDVASAANGMVLKRVGAAWIAAAIQLGDVTGWQDTVAALINSAITNIVGGSPAALDTLNELAAALGSDPNFATTVSTALGNRLRVDAGQALSTGQKAQALGNLGVSALIQTLLDDTTETQALTTLGLGAGLRALRTLATAADIWAALKVGATTAETGVVRKATPADLIAGTADRYPDAAALQMLLPAAMVNFEGSNPTVIRGQRNVGTVVRTTTGAYRITFATPLRDASYIVTTAVSYSGAQTSSCSIVGQTAEYLDVQCFAANAAFAGAFNPDIVCITIFEA
ncbi:hypothetical protein KHC23_08645 [Ancylobacter dichloromethanicus]|uniref:Uncharacterized protein n=1 Tax=Ancylobacter dichloromethanicus TaxID=518825 RepID=A0A9W6N1Z2_9HYPH|nr:hypothetical protein [Ancylobacter dichloromethanicus]MBS7553717.1 hypothetical protein [Ancylobacter dichloromethanicus]GLK74680.1 hypothetical protein GCM10017643_47990 [Ancylobacter dichloromethanicus]